jgi:CRISPR-associated protein Cas1
VAWRGLHLTRAGRLSLADNQLVVAQDDGDVCIPLEDLAWIIIDTPQATLTTALLSACMAAGIAIVACDAAHTPSGIALPFHAHHRQGAVAAIQAGISTPLRKRLWQVVVQTKIRNQAAALRRCGGDGAPLEAMAARVGSGDPDNTEARAARDYWRAFFPAFTREAEADLRNAMLNYGYAVVRAAVARGLVAAGLLPAFGIGHASKTNAFNLADDMVEPFRPFVDVLVRQMSDDGRTKDGKLTVDHRRRLAALPLEDVLVGTETTTLLVATERAGASLVRAMEHGSAALLELPRFPPAPA